MDEKIDHEIEASNRQMLYEKLNAIAYLFVHKYDGLRSGSLEKGWEGRNGIITSIRKDLGLTRNTRTRTTTFQYIFMGLIESERSGCEFSISHLLQMKKGHRTPTIASDSPQAQIVADSLEAGLSINKTYHLLNEHEYEQGNSKISTSAVYHLVKRLNPKIINVQKRKQGSNNPQDDWCRARHLFSKQILIRFGRLVEPLPCQPCFDLRQLTRLDIHQVVWWDETHRKCVIGGISGNRLMALSFTRDADGKLDPNGEYATKKIEVLNCKYEKEGRFGLGCAVVKKKMTKVDTYLLRGRLVRFLIIQAKQLLV